MHERDKMLARKSYNAGDEKLLCRLWQKNLFGNNCEADMECFLPQGFAIGHTTIVVNNAVVIKPIPSNCFTENHPCQVIRNLRTKQINFEHCTPN